MKTNEEMKEWFDGIYTDMYDSIYKRDEVRVLIVYSFSDNQLSADLSGVKWEGILDEQIVAFYKLVDTWKVKWKTVKKKVKFDAEGIFEFLPLEKVMQDWDDDFGGNY